MIDSPRLSLGRRLLDAQIPFFREHFGQVDSQWKADRSRVTEVDLKISREILSALALDFPQDLALSEEAPLPDPACFSEHEYCWVLDPVDGTNNYACGLSSCAISLGLLRHGEPVYGWIYDYGLDAVFHGGPGLGMFCGASRVQPMQRDVAPEQRLLAVHFPLPEEVHLRMLSVLSVLSVLSAYKIRSLGSAALNLLYVALGRMDAVMEHGIKVWDIAAAAALLKACGLEMHGKGADVFPLRADSRVDAPFGYVAGNAELVSLLLAAEAGE